MPLVRLNQIRAIVHRSSLVRFLISGGLNTVATYAVYLFALRVAGYKLAYTIAYVLGISLAFVINRVFVFRSHRGWRSIALFPLVYLAQYLLSLGVIWAWVELLHLPRELGPLIVVAVSVPLTFALSRYVFGAHRQPTA